MHSGYCYDCYYHIVKLQALLSKYSRKWGKKCLCPTCWMLMVVTLNRKKRRLTDHDHHPNSKAFRFLSLSDPLFPSNAFPFSLHVVSPWKWSESVIKQGSLSHKHILIWCMKAGEKMVVLVFLISLYVFFFSWLFFL